MEDERRYYDPPENILDRWTEEELQRLYELYLLECERIDVRPSMSDFHIFLQDRSP